MTPTLSLAEIERLTGGRFGKHNVPCPICSPSRQPQHRKIKVLKVWQHEENFASFNCIHCGIRGYARRDDRAMGRVPFPTLSAAARHDPAVQAAKAASMWRHRQPAVGSIVEVYLCEVRKFNGPIPATMGFLPPVKPGHHPAMIAAFGFPGEPEPGLLCVDRMEVSSVLLTLLAPDGIGPDGRGKASTNRDKFIVGPCLGKPLVLAPPNDLLGLPITEGIESGISVAKATGLGVWASGGSGMMPVLAAAVPIWIDCVTVFGEDDGGRRFAEELTARLQARGIHAELIFLERGDRDDG